MFEEDFEEENFIPKKGFKIPNTAPRSAKEQKNAESQAPKFLSKGERKKAKLDDMKPEPRESLSTRPSLIGSQREARSRSKDREVYKQNNKGQKTPSHPTEELESIRNHYMGGKLKKPKPKKVIEKSRTTFKFEWDASEDTSYDPNPLYNSRFEALPLFGKGTIGGIDIDQQMKTKDKYKDPKGERKLKENDQSYTSRHKSKYFTTGTNRTWKTKDVEDMKDRDWKIFREDSQIQVVQGLSVPPIRTWSESDLKEAILRNIKRVGYKKPTAIQMQSIPLGLARRDMVGLAPTGSGKSAAFLVPLIDYAMGIDQEKFDTSINGPHALVLSPTRELCIQIHGEAQKLAEGLNVTSAICVGGRSMDEQESSFRRGVDIVFATPGRLRDLLDKGLGTLEQCFYVVIDEFDIMIDLGLEEDLNYILDTIPPEFLKSSNQEVALSQELLAKRDHSPFRTTHLFSATLPESLKSVTSRYLRCPCWISIGDPGEGNKEIHHDIVMTKEDSKRGLLLKWVRQSKPQMIVFCSTQDNVEMVERWLRVDRQSVGFYHGSLTQEDRERVIQNFKKGRFEVLVATDLAGRGLDVDGINQVINFDCPKSIEMYVHRAGRTGRAGRKGNCVTFLTDQNTSIYYHLVKYLKQNGQKVPQELEEHSASLVRPGSIFAEKAKELHEQEQREQREIQMISAWKNNG